MTGKECYGNHPLLLAAFQKMRNAIYEFEPEDLALVAAKGVEFAGLDIGVARQKLLTDPALLRKYAPNIRRRHRPEEERFREMDKAGYIFIDHSRRI